jgi:hypothetical protein
MNTPLTLALSRTLLTATLVCATGIAWAQGNAPAASVAPPPPSVTNAAVPEQPERSMAQEQGSAPAATAAPVAPPPTSTAPNAAEQELLDRKTQKTELLHFEDASNRVDEIRSGGQTQRITVQPKNGMPAYEVQPVNPATTTPGTGIGQTGPRVWRIYKF